MRRSRRADRADTRSRTTIRFFFPLKVTARRPIYERYRKFPFTRLSFSNIPRNTPLSPLHDASSLPRVITWEESNVRSKSLFPGFGRLIRICSLTVHPDNGPSFSASPQRERERRPFISRNHFEGFLRFAMRLERKTSNVTSLHLRIKRTCFLTSFESK